MRFTRPSTRKFSRSDKLRRYVITVLAAMLLLALYMTIFSFSAQDAEESGSISFYVSEKCVDVADTLSGKNWTDTFKKQLAEQFEHPIRKLAHFSEYACMGILVYTLWRQWKRRDRRLYLLTVLWVFVSAAGDEFHQYFIPGRWASPADVLLDTCGGAFGMCLCIWAEHRLEQHRTKKINEQNNEGITTDSNTRLK